MKSWNHYLLFLLLALFVLYFPAMYFDFVLWDDNILVYKNPVVVEHTWGAFWQAWTTFDPELYIPVTLLSYQIQERLFGLNPFMFHFFSIALHLINAVLLYLLGMRLLRSQRWALVLAALWALHPLHIETIAWVSARKDLLATFFALLAWYPILGTQRSKSVLLFSATCFLLGLLSKVSIVLLPLAWFLYDRFQNTECNRLPLWYWLLLTIASWVVGTVAIVGKYHGVALSVIEHVLLTMKSTAWTIQQTLLPLYQSIIYEQIDRISITEPQVLWSIAILTFFVGMLVVAYKNRWLLTVWSLLFFLLALVPTLVSFVHDPFIFYAFDRYAYVPSIGLLCAIVCFLRAYVRRNRMGTIAAISIALISFMYLVSIRLPLWRDTDSLHWRALAAAPRSRIIQYGIAINYLINSPNQQLLQSFVASVDDPTGFAEAYHQVGLYAFEDDDFDRALTLFEESISLRSDLPHVLNNYARLLGQLERYEESLCVFRRVVQIDPDFISDQAVLLQLERVNVSCSASLLSK